MRKWTQWKNICFILLGLFVAIIIVKELSLWLTSRHKTVIATLSLAAQPSKKEQSPIQLLSLKSVIIKPKDTLTKIFSRIKIPKNELQKILDLPLSKTYLANLQPGQTLIFQLQKDHSIFQLSYQMNDEQTLVLKRSNDGFIGHMVKKPETTTLLYKSGVIRHSFALAAKNSGLTDKMRDQFISIFRGSINFSRDLHSGDHFSILYTEYYVAGKKDHPGNIQIAELKSKNKTYRAIRFTYPKNRSNYYLPNGQGMKPFLMMPPLAYNHISSFFSYHRYDPVIHRIHPHLGIDYAAPEGTPIKSIGEGKVLFVGRDDGYGNAVIIRYSRKYKALYGHMRHFVRHLHPGEHVHEGQTIGYVGHTGWATGPHLHFSLYVWGIPHDPLKMKFASQTSVPRNYLKQFHNHAHSLLAQLQLFEGPDLADNQQKSKVHDE